VFAGVLLERLAGDDRVRRACCLGIVSVIVVSNLAWNRSLFAQPRKHDGAAFVDRVIAEVPDGAVIIASWTYATPLAYAAYVERRLGHRVVETSWLADDGPYLPRWVRERAVYAVQSSEPPRLAHVRVVAVDAGNPVVYRVEAER
jgi:hypothetical protein